MQEENTKILDGKKMKTKCCLILVISLIGMILIGCTNQTAQTSAPVQDKQAGPVKYSDPPCLGKYFPTCTPAQVKMNGQNKGETIVITIHGFENEKCRYTMIMNDIVAANCSFKKEELTTKVLGQMFGNKEGQDAIIAEACKISSSNYDRESYQLL